MNNITKNALEESLKKFLLQKPLDKITISDLTTDCGISRMAFYYHFKDIYNLIDGPVWRMQKERCRGKRPMTPGRRGFFRFLRQCWKISRLF